jgi:actin
MLESFAMKSGRCAVVFDAGSCSTRVGFSHDATPTTTFRTLVSNGEIPLGCNLEGAKKPVINGFVFNWDEMRTIWEHGFTQLEVGTGDHPVVLTAPTHICLKSQLEKTAQVMFEDFDVPALHLNHPAVLSLVSSGRTTGLVVDSGFCETRCCPIYEGHVLQRALCRGLPIGGQDLAYLLVEALKKRGCKCDFDAANDIKEKSFYLSQDLSNEEASEETFRLPDGRSVTLSKEKYAIPEELYASSMELCGVHEYLFNTLFRCDPDLRRELFGNVVLSGGTSLLPGFAARLEKEMLKMRPDFKSMREWVPKIVAPENRAVSAWIGGALLASLSTFPDACMTREEYNEYGPGLVHTKFF